MSAENIFLYFRILQFNESQTPPIIPRLETKIAPKPPSALVFENQYQPGVIHMYRSFSAVNTIS